MSPYNYEPCGHTFSGDLSIIKDVNLREPYNRVRKINAKRVARKPFLYMRENGLNE